MNRTVNYNILHHRLHRPPPLLPITLEYTMICEWNSYFTEPTKEKLLFYLLCLTYVIGTSLVIIIEPFLSIPCRDDDINNNMAGLEFENALFEYSICKDTRYPQLFYLTRMECERGRHLLAAVFFGSLIGYERRSNDRPAGIRTMALVSLGSALFTINSTFGFLLGPMVSIVVSCLSCSSLGCWLLFGLSLGMGTC